MRNRNTIEYLGIWESLYNPDFKPLEFEGFRKEAGLNAFTLSPQKWINTTNAIGIISKSGRYGGTYAHKDIAFKFASWISVEFELYIVKEFQRLKEEEQKQLGWSAKRELSKSTTASIPTRSNKPDSGRSDRETSEHHLCQRSRRVEWGHVRHDCKDVARAESRLER